MTISLIQQPAIGYGYLSHTKVSISHKTKLNGIYETEVWDKSHIPWDMEIYSMAISQSECDKFLEVE